jgi:hypothetical protein
MTKLFYSFLFLFFSINGFSQFAAGNLALLQTDGTTSNTTVSVVEINTSTPGQAAIQTIAIPGTGANGIRVSASATSTLYASYSSDGSLFSFTGANSADISSNVNTLNPRAVVTLNSTGAASITLPTTYTGGSGNQTRSATSLNNINWYIADQGGVYTNGTSAASPTGNIRAIKPFGGIVYTSSASATVIQVNTVSAITGGTLTGLPGLTNNASLQDFYLVSSGANGNSFDVLYVLSATSNTVGSISKYSLVSGTWTANGTYTTAFGGFGLAAQKDIVGGGAFLFASTGQGALAANSVIKLTDAAGYNTAINITTGNNVTLYTAAAGRIIKGVAFAPVAAPVTPSVTLSVSSNTGTEAAATVITVTATASAAVSGSQTVSLGVSGTNITTGDYNLSAATITIANGATTGTATFAVVDDAVVEGLETAILTISNPSAGITLGATTTQNIAITDNDAALPTVNLSVSANAGSEENTTLITVTATASAAVSGNQTVTIGASGTGITATDYILSGTTITILNGQTTGTRTFKIRNDAETEGTETAVLTISSPSAGITLGTTTTQNISITDFTCQTLLRKSTGTSVNGAEISAFDASTNRVFTVAGPAIEYYSLNNAGIISAPTNIPFGFTSAGNNILPNSIIVRNGVVAVSYAIVDAVSNAQQPGVVAFYTSATGVYISQVTVGYLPDMMIYTPDGTKILTANEGEPNSYGQGNSFDPEGSVSIIDISGGVATATVQTAGFTSFNPNIAALRASGVRIYGPGATVAQDLEPEYIAFSADGATAFITLQENNAIAKLDIATATITQIIPLGLKNHNLAGNGLDASDQDGGAINIQNWPIYGMYQPDAISSFTAGGVNYFITANEGDSRAYTGFSEEIRVGAGGYVLDPTVFPNAATLKLNANLGRLQLTNASGDIDNDGDFDEIHAFGSRSFSIWNSSFSQIFDSGDQLEQITAAQNPTRFNADNTGDQLNTFDTRSDNKGPETEAVTTGTVNGVLYAFVGAERSGDIFVYDITNPAAPVFKQYIDNPLDFGVEGIIFVAANESPTGKPLIIASAEVSKTVTVYEFSLFAATLPTTFTSATLTQSNATSYASCDGLIAKLEQNGTNAVTGTVTAKVWIETIQPTFFVKRHYEITPATNPATSTGRVTLYFTDAEFNDYNTQVPAPALLLPVNSDPGTVTIRKANLLVEKLSGASNNGTGLPGSYPGPAVNIDPVDADIIWNSTDNRWEVSFDITLANGGFSGFFVKTSVGSVLSVALISFTAQPSGNDALLQWKSSSEISHAFYEVQYSVDGRNFNSAGQRDALTGSGEKNYSFLHSNAAALASKIYYRLRMVSLTGAVTYSDIILVRFGYNALVVTDVYPSPTKGIVNIFASASTAKPVAFRITDMNGRLMKAWKITVNGNSNINISNYPGGVYFMEAITAGGNKQHFKIIKE